MDMRIEMRQKLALNQDMLLSAQILQMNALELREYLQEQAMENPVIDLEESGEDEDSQKQREKALEWLESTDEQNRVYVQQDADGAQRDIWNLVGDGQEENLQEYLSAQLLVMKLGREEKRILKYLIETLDEGGYLRLGVEDISSLYGISLEAAQHLLSLLQSLEPAGVGARDLRECLLLQLDRYPGQEPLARVIADRYLELLAGNQLPRLAKKCKVSMEELDHAIGVIRSLDPRPGSGFGKQTAAAYIAPDATVVKFKGYYEVLLNDSLLPRVSLNGYYQEMLRSGQDQETREYLLGKSRQARWVQECIQQRNHTLLRVVKAIIREQEQFFDTGKGLKPLEMRKLAGELGLHESIISRAVREKYLQCTWGIYPLRYFFPAPAVSGQESTLSFAEVGRKIKELIGQEDKRHPLSDQKIMEGLAGENIAISRRTIAKYRGKLGIPDAARRRIYKE